MKEKKDPVEMVLQSLLKGTNKALIHLEKIMYLHKRHTEKVICRQRDKGQV